ncbi:(5-formylfuran-3-yl)methyl phosphate synthase [Aporhodopirellula aestuarii]|uniref:(5-formylfuran-3-yl)methyl phosphate synthase n=1 Tax=Aporhodopirellula aestuarii TaxID=2950107 RepID=A0ABT0UBJ8_9BACT|nr:(5-formylfuran-3-yl)methyl phosphate synthase [Aporhodopirellula aestuarii]MCM2374368.1 (5-formylfuran-3-yl)methyl phosphate synthase [Aporhodopirellula aestuarii]
MIAPNTAPASIAQLLVSVRDISEASLVVSTGIDVIDFKEPHDGPLAPVDPAIWMSASVLFPHASLSAALGETRSALALAARVPPNFRFAKVGPSGLQSATQLERVWRSLALPPNVELVPVAYADHKAADCLDASRVLASAITTNRRRLLIDTFCKNGQSLSEHLPTAQLASLLSDARQAGVWVAFAGSIKLPEALRLHDCGVIPDCWGVRGDVCFATADSSQPRTGQLDVDRVNRWRKALKPSVGCPIIPESGSPERH